MRAWTILLSVIVPRNRFRDLKRCPRAFLCAASASGWWLSLSDADGSIMPGQPFNEAHHQERPLAGSNEEGPPSRRNLPKIHANPNPALVRVAREALKKLH